jgi:hypothetical protein
MSRAEFYRREAERLQTMAQSDLFKDVAAELLKVAAQYERLARPDSPSTEMRQSAR